MKPDPRKVQEIMDICRPTTKIEARAFIGVVHYYKDMWTRLYHVLSPLTVADSGPKGMKYFGMKK